jgi:hypothetical protein
LRDIDPVEAKVSDHMASVLAVASSELASWVPVVVPRMKS